jgi:energy-coupling factor transporter ATP-binding protein EcfA2
LIVGTCSAVRAEELSYRYAQSVHGVEVTELEVQPGEVVHLAGRSGCGKSTLARCLAGLIPHLYHGEMRGEVRVGGLSTRSAPLWKLAERAGMVFQNPASQMIAASVEDEIVFGLENLGLPPDRICERLEAVLAQFGLHELRARSPVTLSGGEQQKVALASMVARRPQVLILDEPLSMLDSTASRDLVGHLAALACSGTATVICEHRLEPLREVPHLRTVDLDGTACARQGWQLPAAAYPSAGGRPFVLHVSRLGVDLGGRTVLRELSFGVASGEVIAVVGRNGAGKTTLLRAMAGLQPYRGTIAAGGERPDLSLVFQNPDLQLFNATVRKEVLYKVPNPDMERYQWLVRALGLECYEDTPPLLLSEGEKKRLALAVALMRAPQHGALLDEPALGQDAAHKAQLIKLARAVADSGRVVIMTTHDLSLAAQADRMLLLGEGAVVADGAPREVLADGVAWSRLGLCVPDWVREAA